ncbi:class A beta-lactamase-related serine hydrolase [Planococcus sp. A6]|uniref:serine hydrolase n=1 Tax=Planococcus sp. A6 TaxID=2992760 RepID=UPI00237BF204|nr:serine hydrolase [Planococcus sp. A6]MDE0582336.1 class A beta-lactamase-related serine hydrolase [Planococcus sp. A6]
MKNAIKELVGESSGRVSVAIKFRSSRVNINSGDTMRAASTIKLALLFEACRQIANGTLSGDRKIAFGDKPTGGAGVLDHLPSLKELALWDVLTLMIIVSDNTASNAVLELLGKDAVNQACNALDLQNTRIERKFMDFQAAEKGLDNRTSASDMVCLLEAFLMQGVLPERERKRAMEILGNQQSRKLTAAIEEEAVQFYGKAGELAGLQADVGILVEGENVAMAAIFVEGAGNPLEAHHLIANIGLLIHQQMKSAT